MKHLAAYARIAWQRSAIRLASRSLPRGRPPRERVYPGSARAPWPSRADEQRAARRWMQKMAGSSVDLSSYFGSGTFYTSGYRDPYVSTALFVRPTYDLGTRFKLSLNGRLYLEQEFTKSALPNGRGFNPYDVWLWLSARELHQFRALADHAWGRPPAWCCRISYESRYAHMVTGVAGGLNLTRTVPVRQRSDPRASAGTSPRRWPASSPSTCTPATCAAARPGDTTAAVPSRRPACAVAGAAGRRPRPSRTAAAGR